MTKTLLTSAAFALLATVSSTAFAEGVDPSKFRQLVVEPKIAEALKANQLAINPKVVAEPKVAIEPRIAIEPEVAPAAKVDVLPIIVDPKKQNPVIAIEPKNVAPRLNIDPRPRPEPSFQLADAADVPEEFEEPAPAPEVFEEEAPQANPEFEEEPAPKAAEKAPETAAPPSDVAGATALYNLLTARGYEVEVLKNDAYGRYVFQVSGEGAVYLLVVEGASGNVLKKKLVRYAHAPAYGYKAPAYGYKAPVYAAPRYTPVYKAPAYDGCDTGHGYGRTAYSRY